MMRPQQWPGALILGLAAVALLLGGAGQAKADVLVGPSSLPFNGSSSDTNWGIQFTALHNSTLTGFDYNHLPVFGGLNPFTGTITLRDITSSTTVYSTPYGPNTPTVITFSGLSVPLQSGHQYQLTATSNVLSGAIDERFQYISLDTPPFSYPVSDADISVTSGVFSGLNTGFQAANAWASFRNITTAAAVPEPTSLALLGLGTASLAGWRLRRKQAAM
jgi:hypothetical protein